jgi:hypothetical protein
MISKEKLYYVGVCLSLVGCIISVIGVIANNVILDHLLAMQVWRFSNYIMVGYFFGNYKGWWEGGISAGAMCILYVIFSITNEWGLQHLNTISV